VTSQSFDLIYANTVGLQILSFPREWGEASFVEGQLRSIFSAPGYAPDAPSEVAFVSGRRKYVCRPFLLNGRTRKSGQAMLGLLLERSPHQGEEIVESARRFHLSPRESACVRHIIRGLTTKEVAQRMAVSPNTVKQYVRLVMGKMGVTTRAGIIGKFLTS
jgi:DNA-binding CsgD family transcriptional regulator